MYKYAGIYLSQYALTFTLQKMAVMRCSDVSFVLVALVWLSANVGSANTAEQLPLNMWRETYSPLRYYDDDWSSTKLDERGLFRRFVAEVNADWLGPDKRRPMTRDAWNVFPLGAVLRKRAHIQKRFWLAPFRSPLNNRFDTNKFLVRVGPQAAFRRAFAKRAPLQGEFGRQYSTERISPRDFRSDLD